MNKSDLAYHNYLLETDGDYELGKFTLACINARISGVKICRKHRQIFGDLKNLDGEYKMTPEEQLFADWYNSEKPLVSQMSDIDLRAHEQELAKIAKEARARLTATKDEIRERESKRKMKGFSATVETDEVTTDAINKVKRGKMSKSEKLKESLKKLGIEAPEIDKIMAAGGMLPFSQMKKLRDDESPTSDASPASDTSNKLINPFANSQTPEKPKEVSVTIIEETNTIVIHEPAKEAETETKTNKNLLNPFAK